MSLSHHIPYILIARMSPLAAVLLVVGALLHCGLPSATAVRANYTELFSSFDLKQRIAYRIGQVECLKTLLSDNGTQYGLGALHRGDYNTDITRFSIKQRIAWHSYMDKYSASEYTSALRETGQDHNVTTNEEVYGSTNP